MQRAALTKYRSDRSRAAHIWLEAWAVALTLHPAMLLCESADQRWLLSKTTKLATDQEGFETNPNVDMCECREEMIGEAVR